MILMSRYWQVIQERFAKLKPREQILVSLACAAVLYMMIDTLFIAPTAAKHKRILQETAQKRQETELLSVQVREIAFKRSQDPDIDNRRRLEEMQIQLSRAQSAIKEQSAMLVAADQMSGMLERLLANHPRLELVELKTLPRSVIDLGSASKPDAGGRPPGPTASGQTGTEAQRGIYRYGLELSVRGGYLDLLGYLRDIEALPGKVFWERMDLVVADFPSATLKLRIYTISFDSAWMKV
jgi:MSHA biogenesis protein MshJ